MRDPTSVFIVLLKSGFYIFKTLLYYFIEVKTLHQARNMSLLLIKPTSVVPGVTDPSHVESTGGAEHASGLRPEDV